MRPHTALATSLVFCACGCGTTMERLDKYGRVRDFIHNHHRNGHKAKPGEYDNRAGVNASNWKGGICKHKDGYIMILSRGHPFEDSRHYVMEHRLIWERHNNAILLPWADVHHINGDKKDNRIQNIRAMMKRDHTILSNHKKEKKITTINCVYCNSLFTDETWVIKRGRRFCSRSCAGKSRYN